MDSETNTLYEAWKGIFFIGDTEYLTSSQWYNVSEQDNSFMKLLMITEATVDPNIT